MLVLPEILAMDSDEREYEWMVAGNNMEPDVWRLSRRE